MTPEQRLELLKWLILRSDALRNAYASRGTFIVAANAALIGAVATILYRALPTGTSTVRSPIAPIPGALLLFGMTLSVASVYLSSSASIHFTWRRGPHRLDDTNKEEERLSRVFLDTTRTFKYYKDRDGFCEGLEKVTVEQLLRAWSDELYADLDIQLRRYKALTYAVLVLAGGLVMFLLALILLVL